jgi:hypothetical protein
MKAMSTLKRQTMPLVQIAPKVSDKQVPKIAKKPPGKVVIIQKKSPKKSSKKQMDGSSDTTRDPIINHMVAYCPDQEDWMETTISLKKTKRKNS